MPELLMRYHPLASDLKCSACGADLKFVRVRGYGDLYQCVSDPCRRQVMHYQKKDSKTCGYAVLSRHGEFGMWVACAAAKE
jgi:ssDNA-binding Zn-finger/Zn-ribbon topoisomerase 1